MASAGDLDSSCSIVASFAEKVDAQFAGRGIREAHQVVLFLLQWEVRGPR